jgi:hypothetical protein
MNLGVDKKKEMAKPKKNSKIKMRFVREIRPTTVNIIQFLNEFCEIFHFLLGKSCTPCFRCREEEVW